MVDNKQKKYKLALWILAVLPLLLYCCEFTSRKEYLKIFFEYLGYGIIILFTFAFIFYRVKFKKSGIMDATYIMDAICDALSLSVTIFVLKPLLFFLHFWCFVKWDPFVYTIRFFFCLSAVRNKNEIKNENYYLMRYCFVLNNCGDVQTLCCGVWSIGLSGFDGKDISGQ